MFKNYFRIVLKSILKNKLVFFLNIIGFGVSLAAFILLTMYVVFEYSYDKFNKNADNIYRIQFDRYEKGEITARCAVTYPVVGPSLKEDFPEVKSFTRLFPIDKSITLSYEGIKFNEGNMFCADNEIFDIFSFPLVKGMKENVLSSPNSIVLSETAAKKYFGKEDPMGRVMNFNDGSINLSLQVTGIFKDIPSNSHAKFNFLISYETLARIVGEMAHKSWSWAQFYTYILLKPGADAASLERKLPAFVAKYKGETLKATNSAERLTLQPLKSIHLHSNLLGEIGTNGSARTVSFLIIIAIFILVIGWINYANLTTVSSMERAREIGVRKVLGATDTQMRKQFLFESVTFNFLSFLLALLIIGLTYSFFKNILGENLFEAVTMSPFIWAGGTLAFVIVSGILSGLYPAFFLSAYKPAVILKGKLSNSTKGIFLRKSLVVFQFVSSIFLIAGTLAVYTQVKFLQNKDIGISVDQTLVIAAPNVTSEDYAMSVEKLKNELKRFTDIKSVTSSTDVPGHNLKINGSIRRVNSDPTDINTYKVIGVDQDFIDAYGLKLIAGRGFANAFGTEDGGVIINRTAARLLKFKDAESALGHKILFSGEKEVIGVVEDYHQESLKKSFQPIVIYLLPENKGYYSVHMKTDDLSGTVNKIRKQWDILFPYSPFEFFFLDDYLDQQYKSEQQFGRIFGVFSVLCIIVASLGLFGLSYFSAIRRTKEMGIRKVMGASFSTVLVLLSKEFMTLIIIANLIAFPLIFFGVRAWLLSFPYRISMGWWMFAVPALFVVIITIITISYETIRTARMDPVKSLRAE